MLGDLQSLVSTSDVLFNQPPEVWFLLCVKFVSCIVGSLDESVTQLTKCKCPAMQKIENTLKDTVRTTTMILKAVPITDVMVCHFNT